MCEIIRINVWVVLVAWCQCFRWCSSRRMWCRSVEVEEVLGWLEIYSTSEVVCMAQARPESTMLLSEGDCACLSVGPLLSISVCFFECSHSPASQRINEETAHNWYSPCIVASLTCSPINERHSSHQPYTSKIPCIIFIHLSILYMVAGRLCLHCSCLDRSQPASAAISPYIWSSD